MMYTDKSYHDVLLFIYTRLIMTRSVYTYRVVHDAVAVNILVTSVADSVQVHVFLSAIRNLSAVILKPFTTTTLYSLKNMHDSKEHLSSLLVTLLYHLLTLLHRNSLQRSSMLGTPSKSLSLAQYLPLPAYPILHCIFHKKLLTRNTS